MDAVSRSLLLVKGVMGDSPTNRLVRMTEEKHMSMLDNQLARGCLLENAGVSEDVAEVAVEDDDGWEAVDDVDEADEGLSSRTRLHMRM